MPRAAARFATQYGTVELISGMALGADTWWAQTALDQQLELATYIPSPDQPGRWQRPDRQEWARLRAAASREVVIGDTYHVRNLHARNQAMLDDADAVVAVWNPAIVTGGTVSAVDKACRMGLPVLHLNPAAESTTWL